jgi:Ca2+-binding EF-hand superfamily protein
MMMMEEMKHIPPPPPPPIFHHHSTLITHPHPPPFIEEIHEVSHSPERFTNSQHISFHHSPPRASHPHSRHRDYSPHDYSPRSTSITHTHVKPIQYSKFENSHYCSPSPVKITSYTSPVSKNDFQKVTQTFHNYSSMHYPSNPHSPAYKSLRTRIDHTEESELVESFKSLISLEKELEFAKQALAYLHDFTLGDAFKIFDMGMTGRIGEIEIRDVFHDFGVYITIEDAKLVLSRYDTNYDMKLSYFEFVEMFLPKDRSSSSTLAERSDHYPNGYYSGIGIPNKTTCDDFANVLNLIMKVENHAENIRQKHS